MRERKRKLITLLGALLVFAGLTLALFPLLQGVYYQRTQTAQGKEKLEQLQAQENSQVNTDEERILEEKYHQVPSLMPADEKEDISSQLEQAEGLLEIPALDLQLKISYGVELSHLKKGPGFYPESGHPAEGNVSIAGHRTTYGAPFEMLHKLEEGDKLHLYYEDKKYTYQVERVFDTHKRDWSVIDSTSAPALTLTTCHPPGSYERRLIVRGYQVETISFRNEDSR